MQPSKGHLQRRLEREQFSEGCGCLQVVWHGRGVGIGRAGSSPKQLARESEAVAPGRGGRKRRSLVLSLGGSDQGKYVG